MDLADNGVVSSEPGVAVGEQLEINYGDDFGLEELN